MLNVFKLGYAEFITKDVEALLHYYTEVMGLSLVERAEDGTAYISSCQDHQNIILRESDNSRLQTIGWQLDRNLSLKEVQGYLRTHGIASEIKSDAQPGVAELLELSDPDENTVHLYQTMELSGPGFRNKGIIPNKLGHIAICSRNAKQVVEFYKEVLGFGITDRMFDVANFMTCNHDHHTLNVVSAQKSLMHHIAFELRGAGHQYHSSDLLVQNNIPILWGPSRHTAGHNIASYHHDPDKHIIELFTSMDIYLPELGYMEPRPWHEDLPQKPKVWDTLSYWGTEYGFNLASVIEEKTLPVQKK
ncbi:VOC family protein [Gottfriedia acidiceleris]|uniref:VOC family protein n=1 Tax=Gottfriedia acidiceleris TaxID=371036 RepID=UPI003D21C44C